MYIERRNDEILRFLRLQNIAPEVYAADILKCYNSYRPLGVNNTYCLSGDFMFNTKSNYCMF